MLDLLPQDCIFQTLSLLSPPEACRASLISTAVQSVADLDALWEGFLPSGYQQILTRTSSPVVFSSKKELFTKLSDTVLIDGGTKAFALDRSTAKICYILGARELSIEWASYPLYWAFRPHHNSRFAEVAELRTTWWLEIQGKINTGVLSPNTLYGAYLVVQFEKRSYGLDLLPSETKLEMGNHESQGTVYLRRHHQEPSNKQEPKRAVVAANNKHTTLRNTTRNIRGRERTPSERKDGWVEIELGEFYTGGGDVEVRMSLKEVKGVHLKGGLTVEGIEIRPKLSETADS